MDKQLWKGKSGFLRDQTSSVLSWVKQPNGTEEGKAFRDPGPDYSHPSWCHNTGGKVVEVHRLNRLPLATQKQLWWEYDIDMRRMRRHSGNLIIAHDLKAQREPTFSGECWRLSALGSSYWHWTGGWAPSAWPFGSWRLSPEAFQRCSDELYSLQTSSYRSWSPPHQPLEMTPTLCRGWAKSMPP